MDRTEQRRQFLIHAAYIGLLLGLVYLLFKWALAYVMPFIVGFGLAFLLKDQITRLAARTHMKRKLAAVCVLALVYVAAGLVTGLIGVSILNAVRTGLQHLPDFLMQTVQPAMESVGQRLEAWSSRLSPALSEWIQAYLDRLPDLLASLSGYAAQTLTELVRGVPGVFVGVTVAVVSSFFFAADYDRVASFVVRQCTPRGQDILFAVKAFLSGTLLRLGRAYGWILLLTFGELTAGFLILRIPHPIGAAAAIAFIDILPVLGVGAVLVPWGILLLLRGEYGTAIGLIVLYAAIDLIRNLVEPKIIGKQTGLHPLATLLSMIVGLKLFGGVGLFLLPLFVIILKHLNDTGKIHLFR